MMRLADAIWIHLARRFHGGGALRCRLWCLVLLLMGPGLAQAGSVGITDLRAWSAPDNTRLVLDLTGAPTYRVKRESDPPRLIVEIKGGQPRTAQRQWGKVDDRVRGVSMEATGKGTRVTVRLAKAAPFKHFALSPYGKKPHRIVLDVLVPRRERISKAKTAPKPARRIAPKALPTAAPIKRGRPFVVVIDAGHGGEDPGATGRYYRTREKDVVLKIARYVAQELKRMPGIRPRLTRDGDYFISLGRRVARANKWSADLFVSIHADTSRNRRTRGTHVYTLAPRSSQDRRAVRVAHMENASDLVGGVQAVARLPMILDRNGAPNSIVESRVLSHLTMDRLNEVNQGARKGRRSEARFWVLKGKRPSILVETGFLSNKQDEKSLRSDKFQRHIAKRIALAVKDYYDSRATTTEFVYTIKKGDNLTHIAKRYGVPVSDLIAVNRLHNASRLKAGARLVIPVRGGVVPKSAVKTVAKPVVKKVSLTRTKPTPPDLFPEPLARAPGKARHHKVRRGENPTRIARRYGVRLADLLAANRMSSRSKLAVGQRLTIPAGRANDRMHRVGRGETLSGLAKRYRVSLSKLARVNDLGVRARLRRGQSLIVPDVGPAPAHAPASRRAWTHRVRSGETLSGLAQRFGVSLSALAKANGLGVRARLLKGQRLTIPAGGGKPQVHVIRRGDSLSRIASRYDVSVDRLRRRNHIANADHLEVGNRLTIPD